MKHTKGKWLIKSQEVGYSIEPEIENDTYCIADVFGYAEDEARDNAKLISKAPEMYEALKNVYEFMSGTNLRNLEILNDLKSLLKEIENE